MGNKIHNDRSGQLRIPKEPDYVLIIIIHLRPNNLSQNASQIHLNTISKKEGCLDHRKRI